MLAAPLDETSADRDRANEVLTPFVPRLVIDWLRESPDDLYREVEGSMAFVDISGFTALSERLARKGKIGAELMRDTLNGVFIALLDTAYDYGAGLLKWGGDALLLLFDGPDHESRACQACWEMQQTLDRVGRLKTGSSTIVLRMSIGISTGTFQFFLTGSVHRELLIAGPDATETVTMEAIADAGEIVVSPRLAARLDRACIGEPKDIAFLLARPPEAAAKRAPDVGDVRGLDLHMCVPVAVRAHVMLERSEPEHRTITAAFIDIMDTDAQLERLGIVGLGRALDERIRTIQEVALHYEVPFYESDIGKSSVKALLTAGAPSSTGRDEERMLRALREIIETPGDVQMRIGVNTGRVFTGDFGPSYRRSYRVFGDAINTAARVMSKAEAGQILATEVVLERSRTTFNTTPIEPFAAKGKTEPIRASMVGPVVGQRVSAMTETPLVGRERELATLLQLVEEARKSSGWIVEISGGPGLGKSRLVQDVLAVAADVSVFHTRCEEYEASTPYYPLRAPFRALLDLNPRDSAIVVAERLRAVAQQVDPTLVPWVPLLGILLGVDIADTPETQALDERFIPERLADVITRFVYTSLAGTTTALVVEDAQYMDESSRDLVRHLARAGMARKQMLFVTHDGTGSLFDSANGDLNTLSFSLLPLSITAAVAILNAVTEDDPLPPHDVEEIARRSDGSPLFLFELLDVVRRTGSVGSLPDSVEAVVAADIDRLSPADRTVLRYASVLGTSVDPTLLARALEGEVELDANVWERLRELVEREELNGQLRFRNTLIREAAYEGLPFRRRRVLHARVADAIVATAGEEDIGALALHYSEARRYESAWRYCLSAGDKAREIYANVEAARFYERALQAGAQIRNLTPAERAAVWVALGSVREAAGLFDPSFEALRRASNLLRDDPVARARIYALRARSRARTGSFTAAMRETAAGLRLVSAYTSKTAAGARAVLGAMRCEVRWQQGHPREAIDIARAAVRDAKASQEMEALARAYTAMDGAYQMLGEPEHAVHDRLALEILQKLGRTREAATIESNLGVQAYSEGRWDEAVAWYRRAHEHALESGDLRSAAVAGANLAEVLVSRGALAEAEAMLPEVRRVLRASGRIPFALLAEMQQTRILTARGELQAAVETLSKIFDEALGLGHSGAILEAAIYFAHSLAQAGDAAEGLAHLDEAARLAGDEAAYYAGPIARAEATCLVALGRFVDAKARIEVALTEAERQKMPYEHLLALRTRAEIAVRMNEDVPLEESRESERLARLLGM